MLSLLSCKFYVHKGKVDFTACMRSDMICITQSAVSSRKAGFWDCIFIAMSQLKCCADFVFYCKFTLLSVRLIDFVNLVSKVHHLVRLMDAVYSLLNKL